MNKHMVNTFVPSWDLVHIAKLLDYKRLGKQRVEAYQIWRALKGITKGWTNHPVTKSWKGYEDALAMYTNTMIREWIHRGYKNTMQFLPHCETPTFPWWWGWDPVRVSHMSNLKRKDNALYPFNVRDDYEYIWPCNYPKWLRCTECIDYVLKYLECEKSMDFTETRAYKKFVESSKPTTYDYYKSHDAPESILKLVSLPNKTFGECLQSIVIELFGLDKSTHRGHDAQYKGQKIEMKSARYWSQKRDCKWQHIMRNHEYDWIIFILLGFKRPKFWIMPKSAIEEYPDVFKVQGGAEGQGVWVSLKDIRMIARSFSSREKLDRIVFG